MSKERQKIGVILLSALLASSLAYEAAGAAPSVSMTVITSDTAPIAQNIALETYKGACVSGQFEAFDAEGEAVIFNILTSPQKGDVAVTDGCKFVYSPHEGKKGTDEFTYTATDESGNISAPAKVTIKIRKNEAGIKYSDMSERSAESAAITLAERGIFTGECIGSGYLFRPDESVTRGEFLAMCFAAAGTEITDASLRTTFLDDGDLSPWLRPYVAAAQASGMIRGCVSCDGERVFLPDSPITVSQACVMLNNAFGITDVVGVFGADSVEAGEALQAAANLSSCGIIDDSFAMSETLTREKAAVMLSGALDVTDTRGGASLLKWAK